VEPRGDRLEVTIGDTGRGISAERMARLGQRYHGSSRSGGLGLIIAKRLLQSHGSELQVDSQPGRGTTIRFSLELSPS
ncbi:MAG: ATP-binding protein, partial [Candidatus Eremiobacterota bacterium]